VSGSKRTSFGATVASANSSIVAYQGRTTVISVSTSIRCASETLSLVQPPIVNPHRHGDDDRASNDECRFNLWCHALVSSCNRTGSAVTGAARAEVIR